ncbi:hypothetical protein OMP43_09280 [Sphingomonas sp. CBMAI 2297]|uniref:hypothetical protein n=1 Tax=Sphingomonas sp. CBMAI 2297 TaxID=2991720 RepID=UPI002453B8B5|nr:hypothetical protein [Sphingomonas sp. CBMAI 2297]MDH4744206.1 hypothetical protein [Sphingomonas sp. CBMAI 2297]
MLEVMPGSACWSAESAGTVFRVEALEGNEAVFLATHSPIRGFSVSGARADEIRTLDERGVLEALTPPGVHHAFCVVEGEPGSGKSHLIRWLYVNWPDNKTDRPLLLQRSDGSLEGALAQLRERLPSEFRELFDGLGTKQKVAEAGRVRTFHSNLLQALKPDHYERPLVDQDWCERWHPAQMLRPDNVEEQWGAPRRILRLISGKDGERNSESARFNVFDVYDLIELVNRDDLKSSKTLSLRAALIGESVDIEEAREAGWDADRVVRELGSKIPQHVAFADALNRRKNDAIQHVVGVTSDSLKKLFREVRRALRARGERLVLLLEDITSWEGLDDSLIDVLTTNADTRSDNEDTRDQCDLVSVVGLTPDYYDTTLRTNYQDRITHKISLGEGEHGIQDVAMMRDSVDRQRFVSRYLAATRAGPESLKVWREAQRIAPDRPPPNPCLDCSRVEVCHAVFGEIDGIGFFPFTPKALDGFFNALNEQDQRRTWKTPRGVIQSILSPSLRQPEILDAGAYPGANIEVRAFDPRTRYASGALGRLLQARSQDETERERLRRTMTFWGATGDLQTTLEPGGNLAFHGVPQAVFEAFRLPWLGGEPGDAVVVPVEAPAIQPELAPPPPPPAPASSIPLDAREPEPIVAQPLPEPTTATPTPAPPASAKSALSTPTRQAKLRLDPANIQQWRKDGGKLQNPNEWNDALFRIADQIDPRTSGYDGWIWSRLIQATTLKIEGTAAARRDLLLLPVEAWLQDGLEAYAEIEGNATATADEIEFRQARLARMLRHLKRHICDYIDKVLGETKRGSPWRPAVAAAQILLVRAWLRGAVLPTASPAEQWRVLLQDEGIAESAPASRTTKWQTLLSATAQQHAGLRTLLRESLSLPQGDSKEFGLASGVAAGAVVVLIRTLKFSDIPAKVLTHTEARKIIETAAEQLVNAHEVLPVMMNDEQRRLADRSDRLLSLLRGRSLRAHGERVDQAVVSASKALPGVASDRVREWKTAYEGVQGTLTDGARDLQRTLSAFGATEEEDAFPEDFGDEAASPAKTLASLVTAQAALLETVFFAFTAGEAVVSLLAEAAGATVEQSGPVAGLEGIHAQGAALIAAANEITTHLKAARAS